MIVILVEGSGDERALPYLLRRANVIRDVSCIDMGGKPNILRLDGGFEKTIIRLAALGGNDFVVLLDKDHTFEPYSTLGEEEAGMNDRADGLSRNIQLPVRIFWARRCYESWLIGGVRRGDSYCGLRRINKPVPGDTEAAPAQPKEWIRDRMARRRYNESVQVCLTKAVDWSQAQRRNNSLRDFVRDI